MTHTVAFSKRPSFRSALYSSAAALVLAMNAASVFAAEDTQIAAAPAATSAQGVEEVVVTARRREEDVQTVPIPVTVLNAGLVADAGAFNVNRLKELIPSVQFYSSNPRNSALNIRGLGSPFGLTNDGLEQGVGLYIDGVYYARPAAAALDFIDVQQVEVLRGPQGTLYGKNTTAGAVNVTTKKPLFTPETDVELSYGNYGFVQAKASVTGPITDNIAARLSFSGTQRDGFVRNVRTQDDINDLNNLGFRGQVLYQASDKLNVILAGDFTRQRPEGYAQLVTRVVPTVRAANRQFNNIIADLGYVLPSTNAFNRVTDTDTPWRSNQDMGGASITFNWDVGVGTLTSISAWRFWTWDPSNDRDFIGLPITTISAGTSKQKQFSQEVRYTGDISDSLNFVVGGFLFRQNIDSDPVQTQEQGSAAARFLLAPSANANTPGLLTGYGQRTTVFSQFDTAAAFGQLEWKITDKLRVLPGLRVNYDRKSVNYDNQVYGGLQTTNAALITLQRSILAPQSYAADIADTNVAYQGTVAYAVTGAVNAYATYAKSYKSVGLNTAGVPNDAAGNPALSAASVRPENVNHFELGLKSEPFQGVTVNVAVFQTDVKDFQAQVMNASVGVLRGYLANAKKVRVRGAELDASAQLNEHFSLNGALTYTDGKYVSFADAPPPIELTGGPTVSDASGTPLPGISKWSGSITGEYVTPGNLLGRDGDIFAAVDFSARTKFSSSATYSAYMNVAGYGLANARLGFRAKDGWDAFLWVRNLTDQHYYEQLAAASGGTGLIVGQPGDPRTFGITVRAHF